MPNAGRALRPALGPGDVLAGRYRLTAPREPLPGDPEDVTRWTAEDTVLARPVDVLLLLAHGRRAPAGRELLTAAAAAGTVAHPALAPVYDAAVEAVPGERYGRPAGDVDVAYVVSEHVRGAPAAEALADGPLEPAAAVDAVVDAAEGLAQAHERGVGHGRVGPARLVLAEDGGVRLTDLAVAAALDRREPDLDDDVHRLAACLYALLTARWPLADAGDGLPPAPRTGGRLASPRQVRAGVPRHVDDVVARALAPRAGAAPLTTAAELAAALRTAADADAAARAAVPRRRRAPLLPPVLRRWLPTALSVALVAGVGVVAFQEGRELGAVEGEETALERLVGSTPSPVPGSGSGGRIDLLAPEVKVAAFDPPPGDLRENDGAVPNVLDGDPGTAWETERYDTTRFGGIKPGVGLLVDLGTPTAVSQVELGASPGLDVELRAADEPFGDAASYPVVASVTDTEDVVRLVPQAPVTARFFLVWLTRLPGERGSVNELFLVRP